MDKWILNSSINFDRTENDKFRQIQARNRTQKAKWRQIIFEFRKIESISIRMNSWFLGFQIHSINSSALVSSHLNNYKEGDRCGLVYFFLLRV